MVDFFAPVDYNKNNLNEERILSVKRYCKLLCLLCTAVLLVCLSGCSDKLKKESYKEEVSIVVETEPTSIAALEAEMSKIAATYDENGILTEAMAVYKGNDEVNSKKGTLYYTYCSHDKEAERATIVILTYDMSTKTVTQVSYEEGNGMFVDAASDTVEPTSIQATFDALFQAVKDNPSMGNKLNGTNIKLTMEFTSTGVEISLI